MDLTKKEPSTTSKETPTSVSSENKPSDRKPLSEVIDKDPSQDRKLPADPRIDSMSFMDNPNYHEAARVLEVSHTDRRDPRVAEKVNFIYNWAKSVSPTGDKLDVLGIMKQAPMGFGVTAIGKTLVNKLYMMTRLDSDRRRIMKEMDLHR